MKDNAKHTPSMQGGIAHLLKDAAGRAQTIAKILMVPPGLREEFYAALVGEFINGISSILQIQNILEEHPDAVVPSYKESFKMIRDIAENVGYSTVQAGEANKLLSKEAKKMHDMLEGVRKELVDMLPEEVRDVALEAMATINELTGIDPNEIDLAHLGLDDIDPSRN